jgi:predicted DNA-binding transcriptional regulator AlpA
MRRFIRPKEAMRLLGVGHTKFWQDYVGPGRLRAVRLGPRSVAYPSDEVNALIDAMIAERDAQPAKLPRPARNRASLRGVS